MRVIIDAFAFFVAELLDPPHHRVGKQLFKLLGIGSNCFSNATVKRVCVPRYVKFLGESCFSCRSPEVVNFDIDSCLVTIRANAFRGSKIKEMSIQG
jgi:hypothetical protein